MGYSSLCHVVPLRASAPVLEFCVLTFQERNELKSELSHLKQSIRATKLSECEAELAALKDELQSQMELSCTLKERLKSVGVNHMSLPSTTRHRFPMAASARLGALSNVGPTHH
jgi:hypothetical protein